jgi:hypothetical protein
VNFATFKHALTCIGGLSTVFGVIVTAGRISVFLAFGLIAVAIGLTAALALIGVFGREDHRSAAQTVLEILLGRGTFPSRLTQFYTPSRFSVLQPSCASTATRHESLCR